MVKNVLGRDIAQELAEKHGLYEGEFVNRAEYRRTAGQVRAIQPGETKLLGSIKEAIEKAGLKDGMTISFHHHFREGDAILNKVMAVIADMGFKDISIAPSSIANVHAPLIDHIKNGVVTNITSSGLRDEVGAAISEGIMDNPVIIRSHGGRASAIETGRIKIDTAFLGAPSSDIYGNVNGTKGNAPCGSLGYAKVDAKYADKVVVLTDHLVPYINTPISIPQTDVDYVVEVDTIGDPDGIAKGATRITQNPKDLMIAEAASKVIVASPYFKEGFSFQTGTGGATLAVSRYLATAMREKNIKASFALGGITTQMGDMLEEGLVESVIDTQTFDKGGIQSMINNPNHYEIDASFYASPSNKGAAVNQLDVVVLSALEIDTDFNVNVLTGSDGVIRGASGGHSDTGAGAKLTIICAPLIRGRIATVVDKVNTVVTPGDSIDIVVTEVGIAVNPKRQDLIDSLKETGLQIFTMEELKNKAYNIVGIPKPIEYGDKTVAVVEYRDGTIIDTVNNIV